MMFIKTTELFDKCLLSPIANTDIYYIRQIIDYFSLERDKYYIFIPKWGKY